MLDSWPKTSHLWRSNFRKLKQIWGQLEISQTNINSIIIGEIFILCSFETLKLSSCNSNFLFEKNDKNLLLGTSTSTSKSNIRIDIGNNIWSLIPFAYLSCFSEVSVSRVAIICLKRLITWADVSLYLSYCVVHAFKIFSDFRSSTICAFSNTACHTKLYSNSFHNESKSLSSDYSSQYVFRRCLGHSGRQWLRQFM